MLTLIKNLLQGGTANTYYFYHIPKTAGVTLSAALLDIFSSDQICPPHLWNELLEYDRKSLSKFRLFRGHFYTALEPFLGHPLKTFVFLRDPIDRALSHYGHIMRAKEHYLHAKAVRLGTFEAFLHDIECRETVRNFQSKCLALKFDVKTLAGSLSEQMLKSLRLEQNIETTPPILNAEQLLDEARLALRRIECICITEYFSDSQKLLCKTFNWPLMKSNERLNENPQKMCASELSAEAAALLKQLNTADLQLYKEAKNTFQQNIQTITNR
jgi:hypothetical protein